ncbi:hypothetical protein Tco_0074742, partial [Tanacetum coccineum]
MSKGNISGVRKPTWNNVQRINKQNQIVPLAVQIRTGSNPVNTAKTSAIMAALESCPKHNMIAYLEKTEGNVEFHEVIDFLRRSYIYHALT